MGKVQIALAILLLASVVSCFLPWLWAEVTHDEVNWSSTNYGYHYIIPLGAIHTAPVAILNVIGFILSAYSFKATERSKELNLIAGILIIIGAIAAFAYTATAAMAEVAGSLRSSVHVGPEYGLGLEALFGLLIIIVGARRMGLVRLMGILGIISGMVVSAIGLYGIMGGSVQFMIGREVSREEGGRIFTIIGLTILLVGIALTYVGFKKTEWLEEENF